MLFAVIGIVLTFLIFFASSSVHLRIQRAFGEKAVRLYKKITLIVIVSYYCAVLILSLIGLIFTRHLQKEAIYLLLSISPFIQLLWCNGALFVSWIYRKRKTYYTLTAFLERRGNAFDEAKVMHDFLREHLYADPQDALWAMKKYKRMKDRER
ncbi:MAG: hypothetical protein J6B77_08270 [Clostridia bacterium]|nr:hypothetical protein [Clostridia bacterium]